MRRIKVQCLAQVCLTTALLVLMLSEYSLGGFAFAALLNQKVIPSQGTVRYTLPLLLRLHLEGNRIVNEMGETAYLRGAYIPNFVWGPGHPNLHTPEGRTAVADRLKELGVPWVKIYFGFRYLDNPDHRANVLDMVNKLTLRRIYVSFCFEPPEQDYYCTYSDYNYVGTGAHHDAKWKLIVDHYLGEATVLYDWVEMIASDFRDNTGVWMIEPMTDVWLDHSTTPVPYTYKGITISGDSEPLPGETSTTDVANREANVYWRVVFDRCVAKIRAINPDIVVNTVNMGPMKMREPFISDPYPDSANIGYSIHRFTHWDMGERWYELYTSGQYAEARQEFENKLLGHFIDFQQQGHFVANTEFGAYLGDPEWRRIIQDEYAIYNSYGVAWQQHWFFGHDPPRGFDLTQGDGLTLSEVGRVWLEYGMKGEI